MGKGNQFNFEHTQNSWMTYDYWLVWCVEIVILTRHPVLDILGLPNVRGEYWLERRTWKIRKYNENNMKLMSARKNLCRASALAISITSRWTAPVRLVSGISQKFNIASLHQLVKLHQLIEDYMRKPNDKKQAELIGSGVLQAARDVIKTNLLDPLQPLEFVSMRTHKHDFCTAYETTTGL